MKLVLAILLSLTAHTALATSTSDVVNTYAQTVSDQYKAALIAVEQMEVMIDQFLANPSAENLELARQAWLAARTPYTITEVYRFYGGPIDDADGPEGSLNAWPLDEAFIDYVAEDQNAGIIQHPELYPTIDINTVKENNEKGGEKNISSGYHAVEFLLWGQDFNEADRALLPGNRSFEDYTTRPYADRRAAYLSASVDLIKEDLKGLIADWDQTQPTYGADFVNPANETQSLTNIFKGIAVLAGSELSQERMFVALDHADQEEEHSCFSDNTTNDIIEDFVGMKIVLENGLIELIRAQDAIIAEEIEDAVAAADFALRAIPAPFDHAISADNAEGRAKVLAGVQSLEVLSETVIQGAAVLGLTITLD